MIALKLAVIFFILGTVFARLNPRLRCTNEQSYAPCNCKEEKNNKYLYMECNQVPLSVVMTVMKTVKKNGKSILQIKIFNKQAKILPAKLFGPTTVYETVFNLPSLESIDRNVFNGQDILRNINFIDTNLKKFPTEALSAVKSLKYLYFSGSRMVGKLDENTFSKLKNARGISVLKLSNNNLHMIKPGTFKWFTNLQQLSLANNNLKGIDGTILPNKSLGSLDLSKNPLKKFPVGILPWLHPGAWLAIKDTNTVFLKPQDYFPIVQRGIFVDLNDNPLNCDCRTFKMVAERLQKYPFIYYLDGMCKAPAGMRQYRYIYTLRPKHFPECS